MRPPSATAYEEDRDALTAQFDAAEVLLKEIQAETAAVRASVEGQKEKVDKATQEVEAAVKEMREGEIKIRDEMREIRDEVNNIKDMLPKVRTTACYVVHSNLRYLSDDGEEQRESIAIARRVTAGTQIAESSPAESRVDWYKWFHNTDHSVKTVYPGVAAVWAKHTFLCSESRHFSFTST